VKAVRNLVILSLAILACGSFALADTQVDVSGQVRIRDEVDHRSFTEDYNTLSFSIMRTRLNVTATKDKNVTAFVQLQDSRTLGGFNQFGDRQSGLLNDSKNVDLHQAWIKVDRLWFDGLGFKSGRMEFNLGNQRVFGAVGWHNVGRVWEGGQLWYKGETWKLTGFGFTAMEMNSSTSDRDFIVGGLVLDLDNPGLQFFVAVENDQDSVGFVDNKLTRATLGGYFKKVQEMWDAEVNLAFQTGTEIPDPLPSTDKLDISALMFTGEVGYLFSGEGKGRVALGIDYASGDDDPTDSDQNAYNNLYYTGHKFRGFMDYFVSSGSAGLMDVMVRGKVNPWPKLLVKADIHIFKTAKDYADPVDGSEGKELGKEIDLTVVSSHVKGLGLSGGASLFKPDQSFVNNTLGLSLGDPDAPTDATYWLYTMFTVNF
jgi:hypothetical protein